MKNEKVGEETYSLIFSSLKHPIRRKILRILEDGELSFSEILEILGIDSGRGYHLENLGDLITHSTHGKYKLSILGTAAVKLMRGVEEHHPPTIPKLRTKIGTPVKVFSAIFAVSLLIISFYSINLTTATQTEVAGWSNIPLALAQNQSFSYSVDFTYGERFETRSASYGIKVVTPDFAGSINEWTEYHLFLDLEFNQTYQLNLTVRESSSKVISSARWDGNPCAFGGDLGAVFTYPGHYEVEIWNVGAESLNGKIGISILERHLHRPLFYYGLGGFLTVILYPIIILLIWCWKRK